MADSKPANLTSSLKDLEVIADWFESQQEIDVEEGLKKVKQAAKLIKSSKARLSEIENEFEEIEKDIAGSSDAVGGEAASDAGSDETVNLDDIPF